MTTNRERATERPATRLPPATGTNTGFAVLAAVLVACSGAKNGQVASTPASIGSQTQSLATSYDPCLRPEPAGLEGGDGLPPGYEIWNDTGLELRAVAEYQGEIVDECVLRPGTWSMERMGPNPLRPFTLTLSGEGVDDLETMYRSTWYGQRYVHEDPEDQHVFVLGRRLQSFYMHREPRPTGSDPGRTGPDPLQVTALYNHLDEAVAVRAGSGAESSAVRPGRTLALEPGEHTVCVRADAFTFVVEAEKLTAVHVALSGGEAGPSPSPGVFVRKPGEHDRPYWTRIPSAGRCPSGSAH